MGQPRPSSLAQKMFKADLRDPIASKFWAGSVTRRVDPDHSHPELARTFSLLLHPPHHAFPIDSAFDISPSLARPMDPQIQAPPLAPDDKSAPTPTSRTSLQRVSSVVSSFNDFKRFLVEQIGFGGILKVPCITRLNLKFSTWLMSKVDVSSRAIVVNPKFKIRFWPADIHKVIGVPCGAREIDSPDNQPSETSVKFLRAVLGMSDRGNQVLKIAEDILCGDISESSSDMEKDAFKIAFVIFTMGYLLAPSTKHDHSAIDYWSALVSTVSIPDFNFCKYIYHDLLQASQKVQSDIHNGTTATHLMGCHIFLQVKYLVTTPS
ncbi:hypothetical protein ACQ4PT_053819 [Festuca glaucescens]